MSDTQEYTVKLQFCGLGRSAAKCLPIVDIFRLLFFYQNSAEQSGKVSVTREVGNPHRLFGKSRMAI